MLEQPRQRGQELRKLALFRAQLPRSGVGLLHLGRCPALGGDERRAQGNLKIELLLIPIGSSRHAGQDTEGLRQLRGGFDHGRARHRLPPGLVPEIDRLLDQTRVCAVVSENFGLGFGSLREALLQRVGNPGVEVLAAGLEERAVGGVLDQRVLEAE